MKGDAENMNKLYTINFQLSNGYIISVYNTWSADDQRRKIEANPEWTFTLEEDNDTHRIYTAR